MKELKRNLLRFIMYTLTERCDNVVVDVIDEAVTTGTGKFTGSCDVISDRSKNKRQKYQVTLLLEKVP